MLVLHPYWLSQCFQVDLRGNVYLGNLRSRLCNLHITNNVKIYLNIYINCLREGWPSKEGSKNIIVSI